MMFSVIYSVDMPRSQTVRGWAPPRSRAWKQTEGDEEAFEDGEWGYRKHRKWCALLTRKQFDAFIDKIGLTMETTETMGSIGAPGCGLACVPAFSFIRRDEYNNPQGWANAYVTPLPDAPPREGDEAWMARAWERIRRAMLSLYG